MNRVSRNLLLAAAVGAATLMAAAPNVVARPGSPQTPLLGVIVTLQHTAADEASVASVATDLLGAVGGQLGFVYTHALNGFSASLPQALIATLLGDARVASIELDQAVHVLDTQPNPPSWGLDRIDQRNRPLNSSYRYTSTGAGVKAYVIDTGIEFSHPDFGGRAISGFDSIDGGTADDCHGHGTHVSGTIGGTTYGVAKQITLVGVRVLSCEGSGTTSQVVAGIDWAIADHQAGQPAVANMSLGGPADGVLDNAVRALVADRVTVAVAAGNGGVLGNPEDACTVSPARVAEAITVAASDINDARASFSNTGPCVDLFGPGVGITSAWLGGGTNTISGTSMATPHVVGVSAQYLQGHPNASPATVRTVLLNKSTKDIISGDGAGCFLIILFCWPATPNNHLLYTNL